ncbi:CDGSH iron-sulfur domain-containing protein [Streptomyces adustus]
MGEDGEVTVSDRFTVAVCTCRRSRTLPWCDTSHRRHGKPHGSTPEGDAPPERSPAPDCPNVPRAGGDAP